MKTLVVYYSRKGYAEQLALARAREEDADFLALETVENTAGYEGFLNCMKFSLSGKSITLFPYETDVSAYDRVILCTPVWCGDISAPMKAFLRKERHHIREAEYILVHFMPGNVEAVADKLDQILRLKRTKWTQVQCVCGHMMKEETGA